MAKVIADKEQISALVDGEIHDKVLLEQLEQEPELADTFGRYHLYGDAMRHDLPSHLHLDLSDKIAAAIADEPAIIAAPSSRMHDDMAQPTESAKVVRPRFGRVAPALRYAGQFAIAASISAAVIVGVQQYSQTDLSSPVLNTVPMSGGAAPVSLNYRSGESSQLVEQDQLEQQRRVHELFLDHELQQRLRQY